MGKASARRRLNFSGFKHGTLVSPASLDLSSADWAAVEYAFNDCMASVVRWGGSMVISVYLDDADVDLTDPKRPVRYPKGTFSGGLRDWNPPKVIAAWSGSQDTRKRDAAARRRRKAMLDRREEEQRLCLDGAIC